MTRRTPLPLRARSGPAASLIVGLLATAGLTGGCQALDGDELASPRPGEVIEQTPGMSPTDDFPFEVVVPDGIVELAVSQPFPLLPKTRHPGVETLRAPEGHRFVGVAWDARSNPLPYDIEEAMSGVEASAIPWEVPRVPAGLALEVEGLGEVELPPQSLGMTGDDGAAYVVVPDDAALTLLVTYDGVTQSLPVPAQSAGTSSPPEPGRAAPLYDLVEQYSAQPHGDTYASCPVPDILEGRGLDSLFLCSADKVWSLPYLSGRGWAPPGRTWLVVEARMSLQHLYHLGDGGHTDYRTRSVSWSATLDGRPPSHRSRVESSTAEHERWRLVFSVPERRRYELGFEATYAGTAVPPNRTAAPRRVRVPVSGSVRVSPVPHD
ncbi:hypothetical protein [Nocardioides ferulae]|uniref:hypothetical protein n=1 Tax=Nocardioides ferulae TaxID=2340821 RepID=UPI000EB12A4B|nr:hypothetical protein [Nocardioides ferulae]